MTHLLLHKTPNSVSSEPGAAHIGIQQLEFGIPRNPEKLEEEDTFSLRTEV
jgi:hypothetical protein